MTDWKRDKVLPSTTYNITTSCGTLHLTVGFQEEKIVEVFGVIGKSGVCPCVLLDSFCKVVSMYLQSPEPRYKISKKFRKQFEDIPACEQAKFTFEGKEYTSCIDIIAKKVVVEIEKQLE